MKIRIEAAPGELQSRLEDVQRLLERVALEKALPVHGDAEPRPLESEALQAAVVRAGQRQTARIRRIMVRRIEQILLKG